MTKGELMNLVYGEDYTNIDSALPQPWVDATSDQLERMGLKFDVSLHCMDYNKARHGQVVNLAEELIRSGKLKELLDELETLRYQDKLRRRLDNEAYAAALAQAGVDGP